jgi:hypothetical protein
MISSRGRQIKAKAGSLVANLATHGGDTSDCSSEEDTSDKVFFEMHAFCVYALRKSNLEAMNRVLKRKKAGGEGKDNNLPAKVLEKNFAGKEPI